MTSEGNAEYRVQYSEHDIPAYFEYARNFTLCDNYFSEVAGPSTPNHLMLICADAPIINNPAHHYRPRPGEGYELKSLPLALGNQSLSWATHIFVTWDDWGGWFDHVVPGKGNLE